MADFKIRLQTSIDKGQAESELMSLMKQFEKNSEIKLTSDVSNVNNSLNSVLKTLEKLNSVSKQINLNKIKTDNSGTSRTLSEFKALTNQYNSLQKQLSKETNPKSISLLKNQLNQVGASINKVKSQLTSTEQELAKAFTTTSTQKLEASLSKTFSSISSKVKVLGTEIQSAFNNPNMNMSQLNSLQTRFQELQNLINNFDMNNISGNSLNSLSTKILDIESKLKSLNQESKQIKLENKFNIDCSKAINQLEKLKSKYASLGKDTSNIDALIAKTKELQSGVNSVNLGNMQNGLNGINKQIGQMKASVSVLNSVKGTFSQIFQSFSALAPGMLIGSSLVSGLRTVKTEILNLDKAMTNLKKVANENDINTQAKLKSITDYAVTTAKEVAGSVSGVVDSMAEAAKMGIKGGMDAIKEVAKYSQIFSNVGDMDINAATSGIATIINAFNVDPIKEYTLNVNGAKQKTTELANAMDILNHAGNNYAIGVDGVLEAMQSGGATMASYGLSIQESTALITASNEAIQNPTKVGNGLKSLVVNLAGLKTSAKDGTISLNKTGIALKKIAGIDIFTDSSKTQVKSMTTLLDEVNEKWDSLTDKERKGLSNAIAGKEQSAVFNALMENYDTYKKMMDEYSSGEQFNSAIKENEKYIDSIEGKLASLKATWTGIGSTIFNSNMMKDTVSALDGFSQGISVVIKTIDDLNLGIPASVISLGLLKKAFSSFRYAGSFKDGISLIGMEIANIPKKMTKLLSSVAKGISLFTGLNVGVLGAAGALGAVALAFGGVVLAIKAVNDANTKATRKWKELNSSIKEHEKAISESSKKEDGLSDKLKKYEKLSNVTKKSKEQQEEYNKILKELAEIDPELVVYDKNGSPIKARIGEVKDLIREYQKARREHEALLAKELKEKADTSYDKYKEQSGDRNKKLTELELLERKLLKFENKATGKYESRLNGDWLGNMLKGNKESIKNTQQYFKNLEEYKKKEKEVLDSITKQRESVSKDQSDWLSNVFGSNENLENIGKKRKKALENVLKLDFSQFNKETMGDLGNRLNDWLANSDYKDTGVFNNYINKVNELNNAWKDGSITSKTYEKNVNDIARILSELTGGKITTEEFAKMLKLPEFDVESAHKTFSDIEEAQNTLKKKIADMGQLKSPKQRLELAYDIIQDEKVPMKIKEKVAEFASDGEISNEELKLLLDLVTQIEENDLEETIDKEIDKLSDKEITQEIAVEYALKVDSSVDYNQYLEELLGDSNLAMDVQVHMNNNDLELLKQDLKDLPPETQVGIMVAAASSGLYSPEELRQFIDLLPEQKQVEIISIIKKSGIMTEEELNELINGTPDKTEKEVKVVISGDKQLNGLSQKLDSLGLGEKEKKSIIVDIQKGNLSGLETSLNKLPKEKRTQVIMEIGEALTSIGTVEAITLRDKIAKIFGIDLSKGTVDGADFYKQNMKKNANITANDHSTWIVDQADFYKKTMGKEIDINANDYATDVINGLNLSPAKKLVSIVANIIGAGKSWISGGKKSKPKFSGGSGGHATMSVNETENKPQTLANNPINENSRTPSNGVDIENQVSPMSVGSFDKVLTDATLSTKITISLTNVWNTLKYGINLFQELENRISRTQNQIDLLALKMENAVGTKRISYLKSQNKLYAEQAKLQKTLFDSLYTKKQNVQNKLKGYGFTLNSQGNLTSYEEQLVKLEQAAEAAEKKASDYKGKNEKTKESLEKAADKAREKLEDAKKLTDEYLSLQYTDIPNAEQEWNKLQNAIKETNDEIERLEFEDKIYKHKNAIEELNIAMEEYKQYQSIASTKADRSQGKDKIKYLKEELNYIKELQKINNQLSAKYSAQRTEYKNKLGSYGVQFDKESGRVTNYDDILNKYQNSEDLEKIKEYLEEYQELTDLQRESNSLYEEQLNDIQDLNNEIKQLELEEKMFPFNNELDKSNSKIEKLQNSLDIIGIKMEHAYGTDKLNLIKEQIKLYEQLEQEQQKQLENMKKQEEILKNELQNNGFKFDYNGDISNINDALSNLKNSSAYEYVMSVLEQWKELHESEIPEAIESIEDYDSAIKDAMKEQLEITKDMEDKISEMIKKQIEDRKDAIKKETETITSELEKRKKAYQDERKEAEYKNDYEEKTDEISKLEKELENAKKDTSLGNKKKIAELEKQLADAKKDLDKFVQDKIDSDIEDSFDEAIKDVEDKNDSKIEELEKEWTDSKISEVIKEALSTGIFTDLDGNITSLQDAMLEFAETSGDALGIMGDVIRNELIANLNVAIDTLKNYADISKELELDAVQSRLPNGTTNTKSVSIGDININLSTQTNSNEKDIANEVEKAINRVLKNATQGV